MLDSAIRRLFQTFDKKNLYLTPVKKSSMDISGLIINHSFIDGNKQ
jgi:prophage maintenance system killer protein